MRKAYSCDLAATAEKYIPGCGMEDFFRDPRKRCGVQGLPVIQTPTGDVYVRPNDWIIYWPDGGKEVISEVLFKRRWDEITKEVNNDEELETSNTEDTATTIEPAIDSTELHEDDNGAGSVCGPVATGESEVQRTDHKSE